MADAAGALYLARATGRTPVEPDFLTGAERERLGRISQAPGRADFLTSRVLMRQALCQERGGQADQWVLERQGACPASGCETSLAHSHPWSLVGLAGQPIGVDLERPRPGSHWRAVARRWFHPVEVEALETASPWKARADFHLMWTLKEAWVKASRRGLAGHFQSLVLERQPDGYRVWTDRPGQPAWCQAGWCEAGCVAAILLAHREAPLPLARLRWRHNAPGKLHQAEPLRVDWWLARMAQEEAGYAR